MPEADTDTDLARSRPSLRLLAAYGLMLAIPILCHCWVFEAGVGGADGWSYFANLESLVLDRDLDLTNNRQAFPESFPARPYMWVDETGRWVTHEPLGPALVDAPFYVLGRLATRVWCPEVKLSRLPYSALDARTIMLVLFVSLAHNLYAAAAMVLVFLTLVEIGARAGVAAGVALLVFFGGPLHYYACNGMSHAPATLAMAAFFYVAARVVRDRTEGRLSRWALFGLGALIGLTSIMRYVCGVIAFPVGLCIFIFSFVDERRARHGGESGRSWLRWLGAALTDQVVIALGCWATAWITLAYWYVQFGHFTGNPHANAHEFVLTWLQPPLVKILFSPRHGFFVFSPVFLLAMLGYGELLLRPGRGTRVAARLSVLALCSFAAVALVYDSYDEWSGDGTYSTRFLTECVVLMSVGLWRFLRPGRLARVRWALAVGLAAFSYALFLLTRAGLIYQDSAFDVGRSLGAYSYVLRERVSIGDVLARIWGSSFTIAFLARHRIVLALALSVVAALIGIAFWLRPPRGGRITSERP